jgi:hypothetical protein
MKSNEYLLAIQLKGSGTLSMDSVALGGPASARR